MHRQALSARAITWIQTYCYEASGRRVQLSPDERAIICRIFDADQQTAEPITGRLAVFLVLLSLCSPLALSGQAPHVPARTDLWSVWKVIETSLELAAVLRRDGGRIVCPELKTAWAA